MKWEEEEIPTGQGWGGCTCTSPGQPAHVFPPGFLCCSAAHQSPATKAGECQRCLGCRESSQCWHSPKAGAKCHVCSGGASLGGYTELGEAQGGDAGAVQGAESGESPLVSSWGGLGGFTGTCGVAPATPRALPTLPLCFRVLESSLGNCSKEALGPARAEGRYVRV